MQSYRVKLADGQVVRRHADHIRRRHSDCDLSVPDDELDDIPNPVPQLQPTTESVANELRRSQRNRRPPDRFQT